MTTVPISAVVVVDEDDPEEVDEAEVLVANVTVGLGIAVTTVDDVIPSAA